MPGNTTHPFKQKRRIRPAAIIQEATSRCKSGQFSTAPLVHGPEPFRHARADVHVDKDHISSTVSRPSGSVQGNLQELAFTSTGCVRGHRWRNHGISPRQDHQLYPWTFWDERPSSCIVGEDQSHSVSVRSLSALTIRSRWWMVVALTPLSSQLTLLTPEQSSVSNYSRTLTGAFGRPKGGPPPTADTSSSRVSKAWSCAH